MKPVVKNKIYLFVAVGLLCVAHVSALTYYGSSETETGVRSALATQVADDTASGGQAVQFSAAAQGETYPAPGTVGYQGNVASLTTINSSATAPSGTYYDNQYGYLQIDAQNYTLDHVYLKGCLDFYGGGTLTITNSIIEPGYGTWCGVVTRAEGSTLHMSDTTVRWRAGYSPDVGSGAGAVMAMGMTTMVLARNDISGMPDGIQINGNNNIIEHNHIHDLAAIGSYPNNTHNDGMQIFDANNLIVRYNRIDLNGFDGEHQNAAIFFQNLGGGTFASPQIYGNFLDGGGYVVRLETPITNASVYNNTFEVLTGSQFYYYYVGPEVTMQQWSNNKTTNNVTITYP